MSVAHVVKKLTLIGSGYLELPENGRRYRFLVERYRHDDGSEYGRIVSVEEIPNVGPHLIIPSWAARDPEEAQALADEWEYEKTHPDPLEAEWWAEHRADAAKNNERYRDWIEERIQLVTGKTVLTTTKRGSS